MHIYRIQKNGSEDFIYGAAMEKETWKQTYGSGERGAESEMYGKSNMPCVKQIANGNLLMAQETQTGALYQPRGVGCGRRWEGGSKGKRYMYTYVLLMLRFDKKQQKSAKQLSFN